MVLLYKRNFEVKMEFKRSVVWFRRDLRFIDHAALDKACSCSQIVIPVFIFDIKILLDIEDKKDKRVYFLFETLKEMEEELLSHGKTLIVRIGDPVIEIPKLAKEFNVECVFTCNDYEQYAIGRDAKVETKLKEFHIQFRSFKDQVIFESKEVLKQNKLPYMIFTPYKNEWLKKVKDSDFNCYSFDYKKFINKEEIKNKSFHWDIKQIGFSPSLLWLKPGRKGALEKLKYFSSKIKDYSEQRDHFSCDGTSHLSVHLRFGTISIREAFRFAYQHQSKGADVWINELIWREFFKMILCEYPHIEKMPFKKEYQSIQWENNEEFFEKWKQGLTGFPIIDAAMRHFNETGWMHNRLRMVVASFLTKDLLIDYRKGEDYFAKKLLDFDLSSNNGGWQWSASTGCDAQPYFRIFNPESQSIKFDPKGNFIRKHFPELSHFGDKTIHAPYKYLLKQHVMKEMALSDCYPKPIIEHDKQRLKAIRLFKKS
jgi:deoxyribodipyrimidine photo-lyase